MSRKFKLARNYCWDRWHKFQSQPKPKKRAHTHIRQTKWNWNQRFNISPFYTFISTLMILLHSHKWSDYLHCIQSFSVDWKDPPSLSLARFPCVTLPTVQHNAHTHTFYLTRTLCAPPEEMAGRLNRWKIIRMIHWHRPTVERKGEPNAKIMDFYSLFLVIQTASKRKWSEGYERK